MFYDMYYAACGGENDSIFRSDTPLKINCRSRESRYAYAETEDFFCFSASSSNLFFPRTLQNGGNVNGSRAQIPAHKKLH